MGDTLLLVTTPASPPASSRRGARVAALLSAPVLVMTAAPARADVPEGWAPVSDVDGLHALGVLVGLPVLLFVLISVAVYIPSMIRGERLLPDHSGGEPQWIGGPRQGVAELPAADGDDSRAGGASGSW
jgi:hypothetical protein